MVETSNGRKLKWSKRQMVETSKRTFTVTITKEGIHIITLIGPLCTLYSIQYTFMAPPDISFDSTFQVFDNRQYMLTTFRLTTTAHSTEWKFNIKYFLLRK